MRILALCLLMATPAAAQDLVYSDQATQSCVDAAESALPIHDCVGASANACIEATTGFPYPTVMENCRRQEFEFWDSRLNTVYGELRSGYVHQQQKFNAMRDMQRAWILYRDARCDYIRIHRQSSDSLAASARYVCLMEATAEQALLLDQQP